MKNFTKDKIKKRFDSSLIKPSVNLLDIKDRKSGYNKALKIVIPGKPIVDGRPRGTMNMDTGIGHFYNPNKNNLMKIFSHIYNGSILENICIMSPMKIYLKAYVKLPGTYKNLNKNNKENLLKETLNAIIKPDNDNLEKVHYDVLQDIEYMVILKDEFITENNTSKFFVRDEKLARVEIEIYYSDKLDNWYKDSLYQSTEYLVYTLSPKYMKMNNIETTDWKRTFLVNVVNWKKSTNGKKDILKAVKRALSLYNAEQIYYLSPGKNRDEAEFNIYKLVEGIVKK